MHPHTPDNAILEDLQQAVAEGRISPDEVMRLLAGRPPVTVADLVDRYLAAANPSTAKKHRSPLVLLRDGWSVLPEDLDAIRPLAAQHGMPMPTDPRPAVRLPRTTKMEADGTDVDAPGRFLLLAAGIGHLPVADVEPDALKVLAKVVRTRAHHREACRDATRRRDGRHAAGYTGITAHNSFRDAVRALFELARDVRDVDLGGRFPPAGIKAIAPPPRRRQKLSDHELQQAWDVTRLGGSDPELDTMLFRAHVTGGARRGGVMGLVLEDLDHSTATIRLHEKNDKVRRQPVPPSLLADLEAFARSRGATAPTDRVFRYRNGRPLTARRYDTWLQRVQAALPWADKRGFDSHTLRAHAGATIERLAGHAVSERFLRHDANNVTAIYTEATEAEVAAAVAAMTGEPHPLDPSGLPS